MPPRFKMSTTCLCKLPSISTSSALRLPLFLAPAFARNTTQSSSATSSRPFTSTPSAQSYRKRSREKNKKRGVSAIRGTGPRVPLSISKYPLPRPVRDSERRKEFQTNPDHGLWGFFDKTRSSMLSPEDEAAHGGLLDLRC